MNKKLIGLAFLMCTVTSGALMAKAAAPAHAIPRFDQDHLESGGQELLTGRDTRGPSADHGHGRMGLDPVMHGRFHFLAPYIHTASGCVGIISFFMFIPTFLLYTK
jgi:hypothetical protein